MMPKKRVIVKKRKKHIRSVSRKIRAHQLEMKLIDVEYTFDNNKILFFILPQTEESTFVNW